jgi:hypothetical protein
MNHRYILESYNSRNSRYACPNCNHRRKTLTRYIDVQTGKHIADEVGKCDRLDACGYHYPPRDYFAGNKPVNSSQPVAAKPFDTLPRHLVDDTTKEYERNNFVQFLTRCFDERTAMRLAGLYKIGTSKHWPGATIFWQIDADDRIRTGKVMLYNRTDGHRVKQPFNHVTWSHTLLSPKSKVASPKSGIDSGLQTQDFRLKQCFFGEHLLKTDPYKTVAIAESEKTAIICTNFYPKYIWLAAGSMEGLSREKCKVLKDRRVILFPDVNGYGKWRMKAREMNLRYVASRFSVDDTLERVASDEERARGIDMADRWIDQLLTIKP